MAGVVVVGGGLVGLCCAQALAGRGADVAVVERGRCGAEASWGNAGWITPALSAPLAAPGVVREGLLSLVRRGGAFRIRPGLDPALLAWLWGFWRAAGDPRRHAAGLDAMLALNAQTFPLYDALRRQGVDFELHETGLLFVALDDAHLRQELVLFETLDGHGYAGEVRRLSAAEIHELEPALAEAVVGGVHALAERHVRPDHLSAKLVTWLREHGVEVAEDCSVEAIEARGGRVTGVRTLAGVMAADAVVVAAGVCTERLLAPLGVRVPLQAAKGYSVTVEGGEAPGRVRHALYLADARLGVSPFDAGVRLAGSFELGGVDLTLRRGRVEALQREVRRYLPGWPFGGRTQEWTGLRPLTPDSLPAIGRAPGYENLHVATGHGMLGVTLAPATGDLVARALLEGETPPELAPFDPARFAR